MSSSDQEIQDFISRFGGSIDTAMEALARYKQAQPTSRYIPPTSPILIDVKNVTKKYHVGKQEIAALSDVSLQIHEGEFIALTGSSGSGKSTLLQLIGGLDMPSAGDIKIDGTNLKKLRDGALSEFRGQTIGFVFQFFYLQPFLKVAKNLEVPAMFARRKTMTRRARLSELAREVNIEDRLNHLPRELSGGQMQRAAIARALMNSPKLLLADEPTGNLDSANSSAIIELFEKIRREMGTTIVIVTHDAKIAAKADRVIQLQDGAIL